MSRFKVAECSIYGVGLDHHDVMVATSKKHSIISIHNYNLDEDTIQHSMAIHIGENEENFKLKVATIAIKYAREHYPVVLTRYPVYVDHYRFKIGNIHYRSNEKGNGMFSIGAIYNTWDAENSIWKTTIRPNQEFYWWPDFDVYLQFPDLPLNEFLASNFSTPVNKLPVSDMDGWQSAINVCNRMHILLDDTDYMFVPDPFNKAEHIDQLMIYPDIIPV
jgi:hypothetical protein